MGKSKIKPFILGVFSVWLVITMFFYFHHRVVIKTVTLPGWELSQEKGANVKVKEIRLKNKQRMLKDFQEDYELTGITKMIFESNLPNRIKRFYGHVISFYNLTYEKRWTIEVAGVYFDSNEKGEESKEDELKIDLILNGEKISFGSTGIRSLKSDVRFFIVEEKDINPNIESLKVNWEWREKQGSEEIAIDFEQSAHNYFDRLPFLIDNFSPANVANDAIWDYRKGKVNQAIVDPIQIDENLGWLKSQDIYSTSTQNIDYFEIYNGYKDVFAVTTGVEFNQNSRGEKDFDGSQTFYLKGDNGNWEIIDISSFEEIQ